MNLYSQCNARKMLHLYVLLFLTVVHKSNESYLWKEMISEDLVYQTYAVDCVSKIAWENFPNADGLLTILVGNNSKNYDLQNMLLKKLQMNFSTTLSNGTEMHFTSFKIRHHGGVYKTYFQPFVWSKYYLLLVENLESFRKLTEILPHLRTYNSRAYFMVYFDNFPEKRRDMALTILTILWKMKCWQSAVMTPVNENQFKIYGLTMRGTTKKCKDVPKLTLKGMCIDGQLISKPNVFTNVIKKNLYGCAIDFLIMKYPPFVLNENAGIEIAMLREIKAYFNFTMNMHIEEISTDWGERYPNKTWSGKLRHVKENEVFGIGNVQATAGMYEDFDISTGYISEQDVWVVPKAQRMDSWKSIYSMFPPNLWLTNAGIMGVGVTLYYLLSKVESVSRLKFGDTILLILQAFIANVVRNQPKHVFLRLLFLIFATYSIIIELLYESLLIDSLTNPLYESQISTENDILNSDLEIGGTSSFRDVFNFPDEEKAKRIYDRYVVVGEEFDNLNYWLRLVSDYRNACIVAGKTYVRYLLSCGDPLVMQNGRQKVYIINDPIISYRCRIVLPKGHYLLDKLDDVIHMYRDFGFIGFWESRYTEKVEYLKIAQRGEVQVPEDIQLKLKHVQGVFDLFLFGCLCGVIAFICEIIWSNVRRKLIRKCSLAKRYIKFFIARK